MVEARQEAGVRGWRGESVCGETEGLRGKVSRGILLKNATGRTSLTMRRRVCGRRGGTRPRRVLPFLFCVDDSEKFLRDAGFACVR